MPVEIKETVYQTKKVTTYVVTSLGTANKVEIRPLDNQMYRMIVHVFQPHLNKTVPVEWAIGYKEELLVSAGKVMLACEANDIKTSIIFQLVDRVNAYLRREKME